MCVENTDVSLPLSYCHLHRLSLRQSEGEMDRLANYNKWPPSPLSKWREEEGRGAMAQDIHQNSTCRWASNQEFSIDKQLWVRRGGGERVGSFMLLKIVGCGQAWSPTSGGKALEDDDWNKNIVNATNIRWNSHTHNKGSICNRAKKSVDRIMSAIKDFTFFNSPHVAFIPRHN